MQRYSIALLPGDGIGQEVVAAARRVLEAAGERFEIRFEFKPYDWGSDYYFRHGLMMPVDALERLREHDALLLGAVGHPDIPDHITLHGMLLPNVVSLGSDDKGMVRLTLSAPAGKRFVAIQLAEDEVLSFNLAYLVAFARSLKLWTSIEFSWSAFGAGRNFIQSAKGPGLLVFEINGQEAKSSEPNFRFAPSRLVAWTPDNTFSFCGIGSVWDVYLNELMIRTVSAREGSFVLLDADATGSDGAPTRVRNILKLLQRVYIPI